MLWLVTIARFGFDTSTPREPRQQSGKSEGRGVVRPSLLIAAISSPVLRPCRPSRRPTGNLRSIRN